MKFATLSNQNYIIYAMKHYDNPKCGGIEEFAEDLGRIKYIKRLLRRYSTGGELKDRLILNHIITLANVFGVEPSVRLLFFKIESELYVHLKPFLVFLQYVTDDMHFDGIRIVDIPLDTGIVQRLRQAHGTH